jgi:hypothetical protein
MSINSEILLNQYIPFNKPVPYNNYNIHALKLCDMFEVSRALDILQIDKNTLGQIEFISMSNLRFILLMAELEQMVAESLEVLLRKVFDVSDDYIIQKYISEKDEFLVIGKLLEATENEVIFEESSMIKIMPNDFDDIRNIILYQTFPDYTDKYIDPDVKRVTDEYYRLKNKGAKNVTLEHKVICVQAKTGMTLEAIGNLTIRNFYQLFDVIVDEDEYIITKSAELNGVKFNNTIEHWAYKEKKDKYAEAFCDADSFVNQVQSAN